VIRLAAALAALLGLGLLCAACGSSGGAPASASAVPQVGLCRNLTAKDIAASSNEEAPVDCADPHDAETYASGPLPDKFAHVAYDDASVGDWVYLTCTDRLQHHLGTDESTLMRSILTWVWFRPTQAAWSAGARWYRCDLVGGQAPAYVDLPTTTDNLLRGKNLSDQWMVCAKGASVDSGTRVPCAQPHDWRAVTTIKVGEPEDTYPGDDAVRAKTAQYCSGSVSAYLGYPAAYDYGYTWFGQDQWDAGNRRSVCWAKTTS
jgi:hypothetical protein